MKKLLELGNRFVSESDWKDLALIKFCLCAIGVIIGALINPKCKKPVIIAAAGVFAATYVPLMIKLVKLIKSGREQAEPVQAVKELIQE